MLAVNSITNAVFTQIASDSVIVSSGFTVTEGEPVINDPNISPWAGVFYGDIDIDPYTIGNSTPYKATVDILVYVMETSNISGQDATHRLSQAQDVVLNALNKDKHFSNTVLMTTGFNITPYKRDLENDSYYYANIITIKTEVRS